MTGYRSPLARFMPVDREDVETIKREGWEMHGILVVSVDDKRLDFVDRQMIERLGKRLYGEKR